MKKILFTVCVLFASLINLAAQFSIGIKAGPTFSRMNYEGDLEAKTLTSFHGGVVAGFNLGTKLSLQPELLYAVKGTRYEGNDDSKMEVQYISLPVMIGYSINNLTLKAGPELNLRVGVNSPLLNILSEDDLFNSTEVSIGAGLAYKFLENLGAEFRYTFGLTEAGNLTFTDVNGNTIDDDGDGKIQAVQLSVFYLIKS